MLTFLSGGVGWAVALSSLGAWGEGVDADLAADGGGSGGVGGGGGVVDARLGGGGGVEVGGTCG